MKIVVFETEPWEEPLFKGSCKGNDVTTTSEQLNADLAPKYKQAEIISPFIYSKLDAKTLGAMSRLKLIATRSTGFDHIDLDYCRKHEITVSNVPTYGDNTVAEHVFALFLAVIRKLPEAVDRTRKGDFTNQGLRGKDIRGKTLGVVGTGSIGRHVIEIALGFGMKVLAFDVRPDEEFASSQGFRYVEMDELLKKSDAITLHVPANKKTEGLLSDEEFAKMKDGVIILNTARGSIIDTDALLRALSSGKVSGAGLDVLDQEPTIREEAELLRSVFRKSHHLDTLLADHVLMHMRNVVVTPHIAFDTDEAVRRITDTTIENIESFCKGEPRNVVGAPHTSRKKTEPVPSRP
jgi:D-lactate dehydrogenase